jgi:hypothetical protein
MKPLLLLVLLAVPLGAESPVAGPRISVDPTSFDFGEIRAGKTFGPERTVDKEFAIRNFGTSELRISGVVPSCGCTLVGDYPKTLKPGASGSLHVQVRLRELAAGHILKTILVKSNDPTKPSLELKLQATVVEAPSD